MTLKTAAQIESDWKSNSRWKGITRAYGAADVVRLRGSIQVEHSLARQGAEKLWRHLHEQPFVNALGALTGNQAMQQVRALDIAHAGELHGDLAAHEFHRHGAPVGETAAVVAPLPELRARDFGGRRVFH